MAPVPPQFVPFSEYAEPFIIPVKAKVLNVSMDAYAGSVDRFGETIGNFFALCGFMMVFYLLTNMTVFISIILSLAFGGCAAPLQILIEGTTKLLDTIAHRISKRHAPVL